MKRVFDFVLALIMLIILSPLLLTIHFIIAATSPGPALFKQIRMGKDNKEFYIYKFRTMKMNTPNIATIDFHDVDQYVTGIGKILRKTSLDELPQLYNIVNGTMSFVGPRPVIIEEKDVIKMRTLYGVYKLTPGLTGWAQVNGRDNLRCEEKVKLDYEYSQKQCMLMDIKIILLTFIKVFKQSDIRLPNNSEVAREEVIELEGQSNYIENESIVKAK